MEVLHRRLPRNQSGSGARLGDVSSLYRVRLHAAHMGQIFAGLREQLLNGMDSSLLDILEHLGNVHTKGLISSLLVCVKCAFCVYSVLQLKGSGQRLAVHGAKSKGCSAWMGKKSMCVGGYRNVDVTLKSSNKRSGPRLMFALCENLVPHMAKRW